MAEQRGAFEKFVNSPYYSESKLCGGAVTVSFFQVRLGKRCTSYNAPPNSRKRKRSNKVSSLTFQMALVYKVALSVIPMSQCRTAAILISFKAGDYTLSRNSAPSVRIFIQSVMKVRQILSIVFISVTESGEGRRTQFSVWKE
jgi:hypothetical protein